MKKLAIVYNICGIRREFIDHYEKTIQEILNQDFSDYELIISGCMNTELCLSRLSKKFPQLMIINTTEVLPVNVTFNLACLEARKKYGDFEGYLYIDSGIGFPNNDIISKMYKSFIKNDAGMLAARVDVDGGYHQWFGVGDSPHNDSDIDSFFDKGDFTIPIGKTVNLHCQIFSSKLLEYYGYLMPDIYASFCTESVFSFVCAALDVPFILSKDAIVTHIHGMEGGSSGFNPAGWISSGKKTWDHPFLVDSVYSIAKDGHKFGFGYEECQSIVNHNPSKYSGYKCLDKNLKNFIKDYQFVGNMNLLDYDLIQRVVL